MRQLTPSLKTSRRVQIGPGLTIVRLKFYQKTCVADLVGLGRCWTPLPRRMQRPYGRVSCGG